MHARAHLHETRAQARASRFGRRRTAARNVDTAKGSVEKVERHVTQTWGTVPSLLRPVAELAQTIATEHADAHPEVPAAELASANRRQRSSRRPSGRPSSGIASPSGCTGRSRHGGSSRSWIRAPSRRPPNGSPTDASSNESNAKPCKSVRKPSRAAISGQRGPALITTEHGQDSACDQSGHAGVAGELISSREALGGQGSQLPSALTAATASSVARAVLSSSAGTSSARDWPPR